MLIHVLDAQLECGDRIIGTHGRQGPFEPPRKGSSDIGRRDKIQLAIAHAPVPASRAASFMLRSIAVMEYCANGKSISHHARPAHGAGDRKSTRLNSSH